ncbi:MAG TPA: carbohydrate ABC transporter permease, partial [Chloroflexota bacterium]|nr:carbohydrate ABC transporter permease [Chloroflexota bacterium]
MKRRQTKRWSISSLIRTVLILLAMVWSLGPLYWMASTAFMPSELDHSVPPVFIFPPTLKNFANLLATTSFTHYLSNTLIVSIFTTIIALLFGSLAAYSFARFRYPGSDTLPLFYLILRMLPRFVLVIPYYLLLRTFGLLNTYTGLILAYT